MEQLTKLTREQHASIEALAQASFDEYERKLSEHPEILALPLAESVLNYVLRGQPNGHFLSYVFENNLRMAASHADGTNSRALSQYGRCLNYIPTVCWGSGTIRQLWIRKGGLKGHLFEAIAREHYPLVEDRRPG